MIKTKKEIKQMKIRFAEQNLERNIERERHAITTTNTSTISPKFKPNTLFVSEDGLRSYQTDDKGNIFKINIPLHLGH